MKEKGKELKGAGRVIGGRMNSAAAASYLGITERTLRFLRDTRKITYHRFGKDCVYDVAELDRCWEASTVRAVQ